MTIIDDKSRIGIRTLSLEETLEMLDRDRKWWSEECEKYLDTFKGQWCLVYHQEVIAGPGNLKALNDNFKRDFSRYDYLPSFHYIRQQSEPGFDDDKNEARNDNNR